MMPEVSAGSNQVGARVTCTAQVSWPSGPAARVEQGTPSTSATATRARTRAVWNLRAQGRDLLRENVEESIGTDPTCRAVMAFPFDRAQAKRTFCCPLQDCSLDSAHAQQTHFSFLLGNA